MRRLDTADIGLREETWDPLLRAFFAQVVARSMH
jgi:hypothetical protein